MLKELKRTKHGLKRTVVQMDRKYRKALVFFQ